MNYPIEQVRQSVATFNVISPVGAEVMGERTGQYRGETVRNAPANAAAPARMMQAARAVGPSMAGRTDFRSLATRMVRQGQGTHPKALARIADYVDKLPNLPGTERLNSLVDAFQSLAETLAQSQHVIRERGAHAAAQADEAQAARDPGLDAAAQDEGPEAATPADGVKPIEGRLFGLLESFDQDVSHQYAALQILREHFAAEGGNEAFEALLDRASETYETGDLGREVRAGMAAAQAAHRDAATLETDPAAIREAYRAMLREAPSLGQLFDRLAPFNAARGYEAALATFLEIAATDLRATGPSTDARFLHGLLSELARLKQMRSVLDGTREAVQRTARLLPPDSRARLDAILITSLLLHFCARGTAGPGEARQLVSPLADAPPIDRLLLANAVETLHRSVPDEAMPGPQARLQQGQAIRLLLDQLVAEEEAAFRAALA